MMAGLEESHLRTRYTRVLEQKRKTDKNGDTSHAEQGARTVFFGSEQWIERAGAAVRDANNRHLPAEYFESRTNAEA